MEVTQGPNDVTGALEANASNPSPLKNDDCRKTRRKTAQQSFVLPPPVVISSSDEAEPSTPTKSTGRRAKKSRRTGRA